VSRIGKIPIKIPKGVKVTITDSNVQVKGPKGNLSTDYNSYVQIKQEGEDVVVSRMANDKKSRSFHGLYQRMLASMVHGVTEGFSKELEIVGIGYKAAMEGKNLVLNLGYSHPVNMAPPEGISFEVPAPN
jgi:large subunit ribosomal protein L6